MNKALIAILSAAVIGAAKKATSSGSFNSEHEREKISRIKKAFNLFGVKDVADYTLQQLQDMNIEPPAPPVAPQGQVVPQEVKLAYQQERKLWDRDALPVLVREQIVYNATKGILKINEDAWEQLNDAQKIGKVVQASAYFELMGTGKKAPFSGKEYNVYDVIQFFDDPKKMGMHKGLIGRSRVKVANILVQVQGKYSRINQNTRHEKIKYPDSVMSTMKCLEFDCFDDEGDKIQEGILERTYASDQANIFPVGFINFIRCIYDTHYYTLNYDMLRVNNDSDWTMAHDDTYIFNPLTSEFGKVVNEWMIGVCKKMAYLGEKYNMISSSGTISATGQSWLSRLYVLCSDVFSDTSVYKKVSEKWSALPKNSEGSPLDGKMPLDLAKDIHMLVAGFLFRLIKQYKDVKLVEYILLSDIGCQNLSPFGACNFDSYKNTIDNLLSNTCNPSYKLTQSTVNEIYTIAGYETGGKYNVFDLDGFGYLVDLVIAQGWNRLLKNCKSDPTIAESVFVTGDFSNLFGYNPENENALSITFGNCSLDWKDNYKWKVNGDYFVNDFTVYYLGRKNEDFRSSVNQSSHTTDILGFLFKSDETFDLKLVSVDNIKNKFLGFGHWLFECMTQLTRVISSGQLELSQYLVSPLLDIRYLDSQAERYGVRPSEYPSHILKNMEKQKRQAKIKTTDEMYRQGVEGMDNGIRKFFSMFIDYALKFKSNDENAFRSFLTLPFNVCMDQMGLAPSPDIDYGKVNQTHPALNPKGFVRYKIPVTIDGLQAELQGFQHLQNAWVYNPDQKNKPLNGKHFINLLKNKSAVEDWNILQSEFNRLNNAGYNLTVMTNQEQRANVEFASLYQKGFIKDIVRLFNHFSRLYSTDSMIISGSPSEKIIGLILGGQDLSSLAPNMFTNYLKNATEFKTEIPTQALSYQGVKIIPTAMGLKQKENESLLAGIRSLGQDKMGIIDLISKTLNAAAVFGVPFTKKIGFMYGVNFDDYPSSKNEKLYIYARNGLLSSRGTNVNPQRYVNFTENVSMVSIPETSFEDLQKGMMPSLLKIYRAQDIILPLIQEVMQKFTTKNSDDFGTDQVYMKVRTLGFHQLAVLSDDPLGFREMYRNMNDHNVGFSALEMIDEKNLPLLNPAMMKYEGIKSILPDVQVSACSKVERDVVLKKLCDSKATINLKGDITYKTQNPLEQELIRLTLPFIHHMMNKKSSLDKPSQQEVSEWEKKFDKLCQNMYANIKKISLMRKLYSFILSRYKNPIMPVADFASMSDKQIEILLSRYEKFGPYQVLEGVNYPTNFLDLVQKQLDAQKVLSQQSPSSYLDFDRSYQKAYDQSYVARQSEKIGALLGILTGGYRIYLPFKGEHLRNIARATNPTQALDTGPSRAITAQDREAIKNRKSFKEIRSLIDVLSTSFSSHAKMCIGGSKFSDDIEDKSAREKQLHLVVVDPKGDLYWVMTMNLQNKQPVNFADWQTLNKSSGGWSQYRRLAYSHNIERISTEEAKEELEVASWVARNFIVWLKGWIESPYMATGNQNWPGVDWHSMATGGASNWKNSPLYKSLTDQITPNQSFENLVNRGVLGWLGDCTQKKGKGHSLAFYEQNCAYWGAVLGDIYLLRELYATVKAADSWTSNERLERIEKLKREGRIQ